MRKKRETDTGEGRSVREKQQMFIRHSTCFPDGVHGQCTIRFAHVDK